MKYRFNAPPGWPPVPEGWQPPYGWQPDPSWPEAPPNWPFWVPEARSESWNSAPVRRRSGKQPTAVPAPIPTQFMAPPPVFAPVPGAPAPDQAAPSTPASTPHLVIGAPPPAAPAAATPPTAPAPAVPQPVQPTVPQPIHTAIAPDHGGLLGKRKRVESENETLRQEIVRLTGLDPKDVAAETAAVQKSIADLKSQHIDAAGILARAYAEADAIRADIIQLRDEQLLQEVGIYEYRHRLEDVVAYKSRLTSLRERIKVAGRTGTAVTATTNWTVNNSAAQGRKMVTEFSKLMLRAYNAEADSLVRDLRAFKVDAAVARLAKTRETIAKLGGTMHIRISDSYHALRVEELELTGDYLVKAEEEKERIREERERQREEAKAQKEFERERARLIKEQSHYQAAIARVTKEEDRAALEEKLAQIEAAIKGVDEREANIRAGYVYVISNVGSFGPDVVKIGLTRRLDPMDRVRELGDASVPFRFDVHALVFSEDAVSLETALHHEFDASRLNRVNVRREYFRATPTEVRDALSRHLGHHLLEFTETPEALEWRQSQNA